MNDKMLIVGNWKMAPVSLADAKKTLQGIKKHAMRTRFVETVVCPPFVFIPELMKLSSGRRISIGAQNVFWEKEGARTGEVSAAMLSSVKVGTVIVGHSERRAMGETDDEVGNKVATALREGLTVVLCVGESVRDRDGTYTKTITTQLKTALASVQRPMAARLVVAYEPVWAIGKDAERPATPSDVLEVSILIKKVLVDTYGQQTAESIPILYGGSVDHTNAQGFLAEGNVRGLLVGRASLTPQSFGVILGIADTLESNRRKKKR